MTCIGLDPAYAKPIAYAYRVGRDWRVDAVAPGELSRFADVFQTAVEHGVTGCVIEGGFVGPNAKTSLGLQYVRGQLLAYAEMAGIEVHVVHPKTWQAACLSQGGWMPQTHKEIAAQAIFRARDICGLDLNEDMAVAVCLADYGERTIQERVTI